MIEEVGWSEPCSGYKQKQALRGGPGLRGGGKYENCIRETDKNGKHHRKREEKIYLETKKKKILCRKTEIKKKKNRDSIEEKKNREEKIEPE